MNNREVIINTPASSMGSLGLTWSDFSKENGTITIEGFFIQIEAAGKSIKEYLPWLTALAIGHEKDAVTRMFELACMKSQAGFFPLVEWISNHIAWLDQDEINQRGRIALIFENNDVHFVEMMLKNGLSANTMGVETLGEETFARMPLLFYAQTPIMAKLLLDYGANPTLICDVRLMDKTGKVLPTHSAETGVANVFEYGSKKVWLSSKLKAETLNVIAQKLKVGDFSDVDAFRYLIDASTKQDLFYRFEHINRLGFDWKSLKAIGGLGVLHEFARKDKVDLANEIIYSKGLTKSEVEEMVDDFGLTPKDYIAFKYGNLPGRNNEDTGSVTLDKTKSKFDCLWDYLYLMKVKSYGLDGIAAQNSAIEYLHACYGLQKMGVNGGQNAFATLFVYFGIESDKLIKKLASACNEEETEFWLDNFMIRFNIKDLLRDDEPLSIKDVFWLLSGIARTDKKTDVLTEEDVRKYLENVKWTKKGLAHIINYGEGLKNGKNTIDDASLEKALVLCQSVGLKKLNNMAETKKKAKTL